MHLQILVAELLVAFAHDTSLSLDLEVVAFDLVLELRELGLEVDQPGRHLQESFCLVVNDHVDDLRF